MTRRLLCLVALLSSSSSLPAHAGEPGADFTRAMAGTGPTIQHCQTDPNCAANPSLCASYPFAPTSCWPTSSGPAKADVIVGGTPVTSTNMLLCSQGGYSLCFFSGPPQPLTDPKNLTPLPCRVGGDGVADCTCRYFTDNDCSLHCSCVKKGTLGVASGMSKKFLVREGLSRGRKRVKSHAREAMSRSAAAIPVS